MVLTWPVRTGETNQNNHVRGPSRRQVVRAATLVALAAATAPMTACDLFNGDPEPAKPDPVAPLIANALDLAARHEAAIAAHPELTERLTPVIEAHRAHAEQLARVSGTALPTGTAVPGTPATAAPVDDVKATLAALRTAEQEGQKAAAAACAEAPADRAALLGSIAAARASHQEVLR